MATGLNKDCQIWDYTYYYENGKIKSRNTEGGPYWGRQKHTKWYDNGKLKYGFGKTNASIEIMETQHIDTYKIHSFSDADFNRDKYIKLKIESNKDTDGWDFFEESFDTGVLFEESSKLRKVYFLKQLN